MTTISTVLHILFPLLFLSLLTLAPAHGQEELTTSQLDIEKLFIEASSKKMLGAVEEAEDLFLQVLKQDDKNDAACYELARLYTARDQLPEGLKMIDKAIRIDPDNEWYLVMKGDIFEKQREWLAAAGIYQSLTKLNPAIQYYDQHLIELYKKSDKWEDALDALDAYEKKAGILPALIRDKFEILDRLGKSEKAIAELEKLIRTYPETTDYYHLAAAYCDEIGAHQKAIAYYRAILKIDPDDAKANLALARDAQTNNAGVHYLSSIENILSNPGINLDVKIRELIPYVEKLANQQDSMLAGKLLQIISNLESIHPDEAKVYSIRGDVLQLSGEISKAREAYEKTVVLNDGIFPVWEQLLRIQYAQKDYEAVIRTAEQAMDVFPNQAQLYFFSGSAYLHKDDPDTAEEYFQQAKMMAYGNSDLSFDILTALGNTYLEKNQNAKALAAFEDANALKPDHPEILHLISRTLLGIGEDPGRALRLAQKALEYNPGQPHYSYTFARCLFQNERYTEARQTLDAAFGDAQKRFPEILELYGDISYATGDVDKAVSYWQESLDKGNPSEILPRKISERKMFH